MMPIAVWYSRLQPGVDPADYESWVERVDYPGAREIPSIQSYRVFRVLGPCVGEANPAYDHDYVEVVEVEDMQAYLRDLEEHPAAKRIVAEIGDYVKSVGSAWGEAVPE